ADAHRRGRERRAHPRPRARGSGAAARPTRGARGGAGGGHMSELAWRRLHPVSPIVRAGRALIAIAVVVVPSLLAGRDRLQSGIQVGIVVVLGLLGFVSWLVTRWCIDGD